MAQHLFGFFRHHIMACDVFDVGFIPIESDLVRDNLIIAYRLAIAMPQSLFSAAPSHGYGEPIPRPVVSGTAFTHWNNSCLPIIT